MFIRSERLFLRPGWPEEWAELLALIDEGLASPIDENFDIDAWFGEEFGKRESR